MQVSKRLPQVGRFMGIEYGVGCWIASREGDRLGGWSGDTRSINPGKAACTISKAGHPSRTVPSGFERLVLSPP